MTLRQYLAIMTFATLLCWTALGFVVLNVDPFTANNLSIVFFYISAFFSLLGTISLLTFGLYGLFSRSPLPMFRHVQRSFRDGLILSAILTFVLYLQGKSLLNFWNFGILIIALVCLAIFFIFDRKYKKSHINTLN